MANPTLGPFFHRTFKLRNTPLFKHGDPDECTKYDRLGFLHREAMMSPTSVAVLTVLWRKLPWSPSDAEELLTASVGATASEDTSALYQKVQKSLFGDNPIPRSELAIMTIHRVLKYEFLMAGLITPETLSLATQLSLMPPEFEIYLKLESISGRTINPAFTEFFSFFLWLKPTIAVGFAFVGEHWRTVGAFREVLDALLGRHLAPSSPPPCLYRDPECRNEVADHDRLDGKFYLILPCHDLHHWVTIQSGAGAGARPIIL
ncbi:hypothetical protein B0H10DRAFT_285253 [Mycena sp. CBHHK59/15]|nr:hypothetical protein B0H10DRAFT_285253 [Mycena sp. CBHHK59/15]